MLMTVWMLNIYAFQLTLFMFNMENEKDLVHDITIFK